MYMLHFANRRNATANTTVDILEVNSESAVPVIMTNIATCVASNIPAFMSCYLICRISNI